MAHPSGARQRYDLGLDFDGTMMLKENHLGRNGGIVETAVETNRATTMKRTSIWVLTVVAAGIMTVSAAEATDGNSTLGGSELPAETTETLKELVTNWTQDWASGNYAQWEAYWAEDAVLMPPNSDRIVGRDALLKYIEGLSVGGGFEFSEWSFAVSGDLAVISNKIQLEAKDASPSSYFNQVLVLRDNDGEWLLQTVIFTQTDALG